MKSGGGMRMLTGLRTLKQFEDVNTYDIDTIQIDGNNRNEIMGAVEKLLTKDGFKMYGRLHKWKLLK